MDAVLEWFNTVTSGGTFLLIGVIAVALLVLSFVLGGIFEALDFGDGPLSLTTISAFGAVFGFVGYASIGAGAEPPMASLYGALTGVLGGLGAWWFAKFFRDSSSTASIKSENLTGKEGMVILRIPGNDNFGEISLPYNGIRHTFAALSREPIAVGTKVLILATISDSSVMVEEVKPNLTEPQENTAPQV